MILRKRKIGTEPSSPNKKIANTFELIPCTEGASILELLNLYSTSSNRIVINKEQLLTFDSQLLDPMSVSVYNGLVYTTDFKRHCVHVFDIYGRFISSWGSSGSGNGQFQFPSGVYASADGCVYVADAGNFRVQVFDKEGKFLGAFGTEGSGPGQFRFCRGIVFSSGFVYVCDVGNHRVQVFDQNGHFVRVFGSEGSGDGQFKYPQGLYVSADRLVFVSDSLNRIQVFDANGTFLLLKRHS
jgi:tripartite motif-containing protein 71